MNAVDVGLKQLKRLIRTRRTLCEALGVPEEAAIVIRERAIRDTGFADGIDFMLDLMSDPDVDGPEVE